MSREVSAIGEWRRKNEGFYEDEEGGAAAAAAATTA